MKRSPYFVIQKHASWQASHDTPDIYTSNLLTSAKFDAELVDTYFWTWNTVLFENKSSFNITTSIIILGQNNETLNNEFRNLEKFVI